MVLDFVVFLGVINKVIFDCIFEYPFLGCLSRCKHFSFHLIIILFLKDSLSKEGYHSQQSREVMKKNIEIDNIEFQRLLLEVLPTKDYFPSNSLAYLGGFVSVVILQCNYEQ